MVYFHDAKVRKIIGSCKQNGKKPVFFRGIFHPVFHEKYGALYVHRIVTCDLRQSVLRTSVLNFQKTKQNLKLFLAAFSGSHHRPSIIRALQAYFRDRLKGDKESCDHSLACLNITLSLITLSLFPSFYLYKAFEGWRD
jgi:hypothetical protein